jgi:hypothetical protein
MPHSKPLFKAAAIKRRVWEEKLSESGKQKIIKR